MALSTEQQLICRTKADEYGLPQPFVLGIIDKESAGNVFWNVGKMNVPAIRPEGHYFYKFLEGKERTEAVAQDLASPKSGGVHVPAKWNAVYAMFQRMVKINKEAAYKSISIGVGQVMGAHANKLGFVTAEAMFQHALKGLDGQLDLMLRLICLPDNASMKRAAQTFDYVTFARLYNGKGYKKNKYDTELRRFTEKWQGKENVTQDTSAVAKRIEDLGFASVEKFQDHYGLNPDGIIGPLTSRAVNEVTGSVKKNIDAPIKGAIVTGTGGALIAVANEAVNSLTGWAEPVQQALTALQSMLASLGPVTFRTVALILVAGAIGFGVSYYLNTRKQLREIAAE